MIADDPTTPGGIEAKEVLDTFDNEVTELYDLYVDGEVISTTAEHPFWVPDKGWVKAKDLVVGSLLQTDKETFVDVDRIERREGDFKVYNFEVEGFPTYFVSELGILVHNTCEPPGRPIVNTPRLSDRVTKALPEGEVRTKAETQQARNFFKNNRQKAKEWWEQREGQEWPANATHYEHPRPLADGGDPLFAEPGFNGPTSPHNTPGPDGLTDFQRWGARGGRRPKKPTNET